MRAALLAGLLAVLGMTPLTGVALGDGDPGSDVLVYQNLFVAGDAGMPVSEQSQLGSLLKAADGAGFTIRVAIISSPADLGAVTALWRKPQAYARFLGHELSLAYTQRLLVVMPNGFGFNWPGHPAGAATRVLSGLQVRSGGSGLSTAAVSAVRTLAAASGVRLAASPGGSAPSATGGSAPVSAPSPSAPESVVGGTGGTGASAPHRRAASLKIRGSSPGPSRPDVAQCVRGFVASRQRMS